MGKFDFYFDERLTRQLEKLANFDEEIAPRVLNESVPILESYVKKEAAKHKRTGILVNSIKKTKAIKNKYGWFVSVRPTGMSKEVMGEDGVVRPRKEPVRNMEVMAHLEYGTSEQEPIPILTKALKDAESEVAEKMQEIFNEVVKIE